MWEKRKQMIIATAVAGLLAAAAPALAAGPVSPPMRQGNPLDTLQGEIDGLNGQLQGLGTQFQGLSSQFQTLNGQFQSLTGQVQNLSGQVQGLLNPPPPTNLTGDYAALGTIVCMNDTSFNDNLTVPPGTTAYAQHYTLAGTIHYDGVGGGNEMLNSMSVSDLTGPNAAPIGTSVATPPGCPFSYALNTAGTFTQTRHSCAITTGGGSVVQMVGNAVMHGAILNGGKMLFIAGVTPTVETTFFGSTRIGARICTRSFIATKTN